MKLYTPVFSLFGMTDPETGQRASVSYRVVSAVAEREGVDPRDLTEPLADVVDTDALDVLFADPEHAPSGCAFDYAGYRVEVDTDGTVSLAKRPRRREVRRN